MAPGPTQRKLLGIDTPSDALRGPQGLAAGDQAAQGPPKLDPPTTARSSKVFSYFEDQVRILVCLMPDPAPSRESLAQIRTTTGSEIQIGYTDATLTLTDVKETKVAGKSWFTAVGRLAATKMAVPRDLWIDDARIRNEKDAKELRRLNRFRKAYEDIVVHEKAHMTEAFDYLSGYSLGYDAAFGGASSELPDLKEFISVMDSSQATASEEGGPIPNSATYWDDKDLGALRGRQRELYITIDNGMSPQIHYHPPPDE